MPKKHSTTVQKEAVSRHGQSSLQRPSSLDRHQQAPPPPPSATAGPKVSSTGLKKKSIGSAPKSVPEARKESASKVRKTTSGPNTARASHPKIVHTRKRRPLQPIELLLGETVINAAGVSIKTTQFVDDDAIIGLYFAAKWCPPCRKLYPQLMLLYEEVRKADVCKFEMIFVSFDNSVDSFNEYLAKMPWWAIPFEHSDRREDIATTFKVEGIPVFLLLEASTLEVINRDGRLFVKMDPRGTKFPWKDVDLPPPSPKAHEAIADALATVAAVSELLADNSSTSDKNASVESASKLVPVANRSDTKEGSGLIRSGEASPKENKVSNRTSLELNKDVEKSRSK